MRTCTELNFVAPVIAVSSAIKRNLISFNSRASDSCKQATTAYVMSHSAL